MVATTDQKERALALCDSVKDLLEKDSRNPLRVADALQRIKDGDARFLTGIVSARAKSIPFVDRSPNEQWENVYRMVCGKKIDCAGIALPRKPDFACWPVIVTPYIPLNMVFAQLKRNFPCSSYYGDDLEKTINWSNEERDSRKEAYGIWVRAVVEATEDMNNVSALTISQRGIKTTTLHERLCFEAFHWVLTGGKKKGTHLDRIGWNICSGSRSSDGSVPCVCWGGGGVRVHWRGHAGADAGMGARQVVS